MSRPISKKCVACAALKIDEARIVHGPKAEKESDRCWDDKTCKRRRSHYRNRLKINEARRLAYQQQQAAETEQASDATSDDSVETVSLSVAEESLPYANLYIWREKRKDAPLHAIGVSVFKGGEKVLEVEPIHCAGYKRRQLEEYVQEKIMGYLKARYEITFFSEEIRLEPIECKIEGCPFHDRLSAREEMIHG